MFTCTVVFKINIQGARHFKDEGFLLARVKGLGFLRYLNDTFSTGLD